MDNNSSSRLAQREIRRNTRNAIVYLVSTLILMLGLIMFGIPALIKLAVFLGDLKSSSQPIEEQQTLPPPPPRLKPVPAATNNSQLEIEGFSEPGSTVEIFVSELSEGTVVTDSDGSFKFGSVVLTQGVNSIYAVAKDTDGTISRPSGRLKIIFSNQAPELEISEPADQSRYNVSKTKVEVKGKTNPEAKLTINNHMVIVNSDGSFAYSVNLSSGENKIVIAAIDEANNKTEKELTLIRD